MNDKVSIINVDGIELHTSLTPIELANLPQKYAELQSNWNSLKEFVIQLQKLKGINQQGFSWGVAQEVLDKEFPELAAKVELHIPDENSRRVGQSVAAASLPELKK